MNDTKMNMIQNSKDRILILLILLCCLMGIWFIYTSIVKPIHTIHTRIITFHLWPLIPTLLFIIGILIFIFLFGIQLNKIFVERKKNQEKIKKEQLLNDHTKIIEQLEEKSLE